MTLSTHLLAQFDRWIDDRRVASGAPGLAYAITSREGLVHAAQFGVANLYSGAPVTGETLFQTGSTGKAFTAVVLHQLASEGRIDLDAPVTEYLPWFAVRSSHPPIRLWHLLSHSGGITSGIDFAPDGRYQVWTLRQTETAAAPGEVFHYSNIGYKVLGLILEDVCGARYRDIVTERILDPLGMTRAIGSIANSDRPRLADGHNPMLDDRPWWPGRPLVPATWLETDTADGALAMTAPDLATWLRALMNGGAYPGGRLLSPSAFARFADRLMPIPRSDGESSWYGHGIITATRAGRTMLGHTGGMVGSYTGMWADLDTGYGAVVLVNGPGTPNALVSAMLDAIHAHLSGGTVALPPLPDPRTVADAADIAGRYCDPDGRLPNIVLTAERGGLAADFGAERFPLLRYGNSGFVSDHPALDGYPLMRDGDHLTHGPRRWLRADTAAPPAAPLPADLAPFAGYYRSHNPWTTNFRVFPRDGRLWLAFPASPDGLDAEQPLVPLGDGRFRCGDDPRIPEEIRFDTVIDGVALRAVLAIGEYVRAHDPLEAMR